ncbi:hypothetical protein RHGRI_035312 [Rhododendron griersonianum]|uniref:Late embryogenesis abundant protein n=1 Tax=Rhododendron griersonianum TaxID=479676 RepID=A0AAV6I419_9ERIC|nr:hypothetical protein RHGRI_035312 [Rhododendron griersonianum]
MKAADSKKWAAIKKAKVAEDKAAKYVARAETKEKEATEARELADKYVADAKKMGSEAQAARGAAGAASKHVEVPKKKCGGSCLGTRKSFFTDKPVNLFCPCFSFFTCPCLSSTIYPYPSLIVSSNFISTQFAIPLLRLWFFDLNKFEGERKEHHISMDHAKAELKVADSKKWAAIKKAKEAEDKAAKYVARAERKEKEAAEARELADKYAADAKKMGAEAQAARAAADAASKHVEGKKK